MKNNTFDNITKAKSELIISQPFFATLLLSMEIVEDNTIPTAATDGEKIIYNKNWTDSLTHQETVFVLAHEVLHCVFKHMIYIGDRTPNRWNQACDYVINEILVDEGVGNMPTQGLLNRALTKSGGHTAPGVYALLPEDSENKKPGEVGGALDHVHQAGSDMGKSPVDSGKAKKMREDWAIKINQARDSAKMQGQLSAGIARLVEKILEPVYDWKEILRKFVSEKTKQELTWQRPKRRFLHDDLYLPSLGGEKLGEICIAVDCSGSVDDGLLAVFSAEIKAIKEDLLPSKITVIYFDHGICGEPDVFLAHDDLEINARGGGGTAFSPVFKEIEKFETPPTAVIFLTDLYCNDFGDAPDFPVLWCCPDGGNTTAKVPFGEILKVM